MTRLGGRMGNSPRWHPKRVTASLKGGILYFLGTNGGKRLFFTPSRSCLFLHNSILASRAQTLENHNSSCCILQQRWMQALHTSGLSVMNHWGQSLQFDPCSGVGETPVYSDTLGIAPSFSRDYLTSLRSVAYSMHAIERRLALLQLQT